MKKIATLKTILTVAAVMTAFTISVAESASMRIAGATAPPIGHVQFCGDHPDECGRYDRANQVVKLTSASWTRLQTVNSGVNAAVLPATDMQIYGVVERWDYPRLAGDCEDYALEKRRELIAEGWPASSLLMTVVKDEVGDGHAVLTVRTDRGDFILDNKTDVVEAWDRTPYRFLKRQSTVNAGAWDKIADGRDVLVGSVGTR